MWKMELQFWRRFLSSSPSKDMNTTNSNVQSTPQKREAHRLRKVCAAELIRAFLKSREESGSITDVGPGLSSVDCSSVIDCALILKYQGVSEAFSA